MNQRGESHEKAIQYTLERLHVNHNYSWLENRQKQLFDLFFKEHTVHVDPNEKLGEGLVDRLPDIYYELCGRNGDFKDQALKVAFIIEELRFPFGERRFPMTKPSERELILLCSGEDMSKMKEGDQISFDVVSLPKIDDRRTDYRVNPTIQGRTFTGLKVQMRLLDGDLVSKDETSRYRQLSNMIREANSSGVDRLNEFIENEFGIRAGMTIEGRIVDASRMPMRVALKISADSILDDLSSPLTWDEYFRPIDFGEDKKKEFNKQMPNFRTRNIAHPIYQNLSEMEAQAILSAPDKKVGDAILRPSSKGFANLNLVWRWSQDPVKFEVLPIEERAVDGSPKDPTDPALGGRLVMKGKNYEAIDEILALFLDPIAKRIKDLQSHKYYRNCTIEEIEGLIRDQRIQNPKAIPYYFVTHKSEPRTFYLAYQNTKDGPKRFRVIARAEGLDLVNKTGFRNINGLVEHFKRHVKDLEEANQRTTRKQPKQGSRWEPAAAPQVQYMPQPQQPAFSFVPNDPSGGGWNPVPPPLPMPMAAAAGPGGWQQPPPLQPRTHYRPPVVYE